MLHYRTKCFAHRGLHGDRNIAPENSLAAFKRAVRRGYGMELDIQFSRDHQIVVFHDETLQRVCQVEGKVSDYTYRELQQFPLYQSQQRIPLLKDVLNLTKGRVPLLIEFKTPGNRFDRRLCEDTAALLDTYQGPFCIESFHPMVLYWFRKHRPLVRRGQLCTNFFRTHAKGQRWQFFLLETMVTNFLTKPDFIAYDHRFRRSLFFRIWKHFTTPVGWTVRSSSEFKKCRNDFDYFIMEQCPSSD
ncbi:MAG: glycerophosphodiester phosphodiesterase family protein [Clostridiales bacterium]|nr:glycerophosphodiester phosphodiesterase family protein [Clostridiales bacterium]